MTDINIQRPEPETDKFSVFFPEVALFKQGVRTPKYNKNSLRHVKRVWPKSETDMLNASYPEDALSALWLRVDTHMMWVRPRMSMSRRWVNSWVRNTTQYRGACLWLWRLVHSWFLIDRSFKPNATTLDTSKHDLLLLFKNLINSISIFPYCMQ